MALINCPECGKEISDKAPACPNCGFAGKQDICPKCGKPRLSEPRKESGFRIGCAIIGVLLFGIIGLVAFGPAGFLVGASLGILGGFELGRRKYIRVCLNCGEEFEFAGGFQLPCSVLAALIVAAVIGLCVASSVGMYKRYLIGLP